MTRKVILHSWKDCDRCKNAINLLKEQNISFEIVECDKSGYRCESLEQQLQCYHYPMIQVIEKAYSNGIYIDHSTVFHFSNKIDEVKAKKINKKITSIPSITLNELISKLVDFINNKTII